MGLCKCRTVSNLFCFQHCKNVCQECVTDHERCIIKSYLLWLQDSDVDDICSLCKKSLEEGELLRLTCFDVFHLDCINLMLDGQKNKPQCPDCKTAIIPPESMTTALATTIRQKLKNFEWIHETDLEVKTVIDIPEPEKEPVERPVNGFPKPLFLEERTRLIGSFEEQSNRWSIRNLFNKIYYNLRYSNSMRFFNFQRIVVIVLLIIFLFLIYETAKQILDIKNK